MNHISEDKLLEYALGTIESESESAEISEHLKKCRECRNSLASIKNDIDMLAGIKPNKHIKIPSQQSRSKTFAYSLLKIAALLIIGFIAGIGSSVLLYERPVRVMPSYTKLSPPADSLANMAISDATRPGTDYIDISNGN